MEDYVRAEYPMSAITEQNAANFVVWSVVTEDYVSHDGGIGEPFLVNNTILNY